MTQHYTVFTNAYASQPTVIAMSSNGDVAMYNRPLTPAQALKLVAEAKAHLKAGNRLNTEHWTAIQTPAQAAAPAPAPAKRSRKAKAA